MCSKHILEIMFNEPQLLLVFRVALEIERVYGFQNDIDDTDEGLEYNNLTGNDFMALEGAVPLYLDPLNNYDPNDQGNLALKFKNIVLGVLRKYDM